MWDIIIIVYINGVFFYFRFGIMIDEVNDTSYSNYIVYYPPIVIIYNLL